MNAHSPTTPPAHQRSSDIEFSVPLKHRLRVTDDVAGGDFSVLRDVIEPSESGPAKVLVWAETDVADSSGRVAKIFDQLRRDDSLCVPASVQTVPGGEAIKNCRAAVDRFLEAINRHDLDRRSYIIAIGGGAFLDAAGFAAAIAHRGVRLIRVPTTTLAQADSGVGVKNAINGFGKKNWIGTFAVPWAVINDTALLETLPDRDFHSGFSEAVKVALLKQRDGFEWLCENASAIRRRERAVCAEAIDRSCRLHLQHITAGGDPFEAREARPLDFGHWSAHRLEPVTEYRLRHGEAVAIGVAIDCLYSSMRHGLPEADAARVCHCLRDLGLTLWDEALNPVDRLLVGLEEFRQHLGGRLTLTMLRGVGDPIHVHSVDHDLMKAAIIRLAELQS